MEREKIDDILKDKLYDYTPERDVPSWSQMQKRMIIDANSKGIPLSRRHTSHFLRYAAVAALILFIGAGLYYSLRIIPDLSTDHNIANKIEPSHFEQSETTGKEPAFPIDPELDELLRSARKVAVVNTKQAADGVEVTMFKAIAKNDPNRTNANIKEENVSDAQDFSRHPAKSMKSYSNSEKTGLFDRHTQNYNSKLRNFARTRKNGSKEWVASAFFRGGASSMSSKIGSSASPTFSLLTSSPFMEINNSRNEVLSDAVPKDLKHKYPISVGLKIRKNITPRIGIETGLVYSYMESSTQLSAAFNYSYSQRLHYLGIPVSISYSMLNSKRWDLYLNGGGMAEIALSAKGVTKIYEGDTFASRNTSSLGAKGLVWSLNAGLGIGYNFIDNFGIYLEPGVSYYFDNNKQPESYRTVHPFMFNMNAGLRFKF